MDRFSLSWLAPEFEHRPKGPVWFWGSVVLALALLVYAVAARNLLFALLVVIGELLLIVSGSRTPEELSVTVDARGITIGTHKFYPRSHIAAFSIVENQDATWHDLIILIDNRYLPTVRVHVPEHLVSALREYLRTLYPEYDHQESFLDILERFFGF